MNGNLFIYLSLVSLVCWWIGAFAALKKRRIVMGIFSCVGLFVFASYIAILWFSLGRPPLKTMGETRLWYVFFLPLVGLITYAKKGYIWIPLFSSLMATVFLSINLLHPEIQSQTLMPALQSMWFAPHVIIYMFAYALMGASFLVAICLLIRRTPVSLEEIEICDDITSVGVGVLTLGMLIGAIWAKQAWGDYWSWDPKETWAAATWLLYLGYLHYRENSKVANKPALWILIIAFICMQMCWWGINLLPAAEGMSVHSY
ncbi:MAG: cytochrome c biogenesis protein CcsA [Bacteroidales bacterium]|nr:cytochrome c biogenesis protein CcsA [Bacteroidales bacterium]